MSTTPNPLSSVASGASAATPVPVAPSPDGRSPRAAAIHDRVSASGTDRLARTLGERQLFARYRRRGDLAARDQLVERFLSLATRLAQRYHRGAEPLEDLVQVASLGLLKAIDRFDPERGTAFSSFAVPTITGELKRHFRDKGWWLRVPRDLQDLALRVERVADELGAALRRAPTPDEIAHHLGIRAEEVLEAREAADAHAAISLDGPRDDPEAGGPIAETIGGEDPGYKSTEDAVTLEHLMNALTSREREILRLRFVEDLTQSQIGARVGVSQMHVSRLIRQSIARLREAAQLEHIARITPPGSSTVRRRRSSAAPSAATDQLRRAPRS